MKSGMTTNLLKMSKRQVLAKLKQIGQDHPPELIYYKTLYELFREEIETRKTNDQTLEDIHLYDMEIWKKLYEFQKEGAKSVSSLGCYDTTDASWQIASGWEKPIHSARCNQVL